MPYPLQPNLQPAPFWYRRIIISALLCIVVCLSAWFAHQQKSPIHNTLLGNDQQNYLRTVEKLFSQAQQRIWIMMYVVRRYDQKQHSINTLCQALAQAAQRNVDVRIVLDHSDPQATYPGPDNSEVVQWLTENGIRVIYDEFERTTHAKIVVCDQQVIIGSHNWTGYAVSKNREISVLTDDTTILRDIEKVFQEIPNFSQ